MKNIKNLKNTVVIKSKGILKLSNESSINNNSIKSKKMNPIALNLKNISSIKNSNNNIKKINPYNYSKIKNHSLNSDTNQTSKKIRRNLILRGNNIFRTFDNHSNSDSYSSTHNSSAKNFSETFRKFFLQNDDKKMSKNYSRNRKKNSILGGITNSYTYDTFQNEGVYLIYLTLIYDRNEMPFFLKTYIYINKYNLKILMDLFVINRLLKKKNIHIKHSLI
jgi:hypothetical protein